MAAMALLGAVHHAGVFAPGPGATGPAASASEIESSARAVVPPADHVAAALTEEQFEDLASRDPGLALRLAAAETNTVRALELRHRVLRIWAAKNPEAAAAWANALPNGEWQPALAAVFVGAAENPDEAMRVARALCAENPSQAGDYGQILIMSLATVGAYETGARFALATGEDVEHRAAWLHTAFFHYGMHQPTAALTLIERLGASSVSSVTFQGAISGWAATNPAQAANYAIGLAPGPDRTFALSETLPQWVSRDAVKAAAWILQFDPISDMDAGAAAVASQSGLVQQQPDAAFRWAASIAEPTLRANTLRSLALQCAPQNAGAIRDFLRRIPDLPESDRSALLDSLSPNPDA
ncbi:MAG TPA: hypothetical protein VHO24_14990 [Opitutaceae bacterium]|nr:hypothetical protein [Opitutaceae bacterium]